MRRSAVGRVRPTARGLGFLAGGALTVAGALVLDSVTLLVVGVGLCTCWAACGVWLSVRRRRDLGAAGLKVHRLLDPNPAPAGTEVELRTGLVAAPGTVPPPLTDRMSGRLRITGRMGPGHFLVQADRRGRWSLGPMTARRRDPLGLFRAAYPVGGTASLVAWPRIHPVERHPLPPVPQGRHSPGPGLTAASLDDVTLREYRPGDDLRRIHWRASARHGELLTRADEPAGTSRPTLVMSLPAGGAIDSTPPQRTAEWIVSAVASWAAVLGGEGPLGLVGTGLAAFGETPELLDLLTDVRAPARAAAVADQIAAAVEHLREAEAGPVLAVIPELDPVTLEVLAEVASSRPALAMVVSPDPQGATGRAEAAVQVLIRSGWRAARVDAGQEIPLAARTLFAEGPTR